MTDIDEATYKKEKEDFVSNLSGSSLEEILLVILVVPVRIKSYYYYITIFRLAYCKLPPYFKFNSCNGKIPASTIPKLNLANSYNYFIGYYTISKEFNEKIRIFTS
jgi:hypothetical protein